MTSTNFNVGMNESRNSSRVLKPPGGGHSDIFGTYESQDPTPRRFNNQPRSTIGEVFSIGAPKPMNHNHSTVNKTEDEPQDQELQVTNENEVPKTVIPAPQRARIPPGGFSSGLW